MIGEWADGARLKRDAEGNEGRWRRHGITPATPGIQTTSFQLPSFSPTLAAQLIDIPRHLSVHVGGMLITAQPLVEVVPLEHATKPGVVVAQWNKDSVEDAGLIKIDLLSLRTLGMLTEVCALIERRHGRQARPGRAAAGRSRRLPAAGRRGHHRLLPGGEPRPKLDAAAAPTRAASRT